MIIIYTNRKLERGSFRNVWQPYRESSQAVYVYVKPDAGNKPETGNQMAELKKYSSAAAIILQRTAVLRFQAYTIQHFVNCELS